MQLCSDFSTSFLILCFLLLPSSLHFFLPSFFASLLFFFILSIIMGRKNPRDFDLRSESQHESIEAKKKKKKKSTCVTSHPSILPPLSKKAMETLLTWLVLSLQSKLYPIPPCVSFGVTWVADVPPTSPIVYAVLSSLTLCCPSIPPASTPSCQNSTYSFKNIYIYWLCWVFTAAYGLLSSPPVIYIYSWVPLKYVPLHKQPDFPMPLLRIV